ncbi:hypothetical protein KJY73_04830 [Bowmanella sp. Y26]|uniref:hypothetical protein n=1 Tax=Bowmanella yangjiangensis TaxID=2811230 RepID=UPI001BDCA0A6|nr:hypothetical protein [Bowmanella yangjiangensis]MBT1062886.1 hypothetical protein [Bowmanella yangjiangensis]
MQKDIENLIIEHVEIAVRNGLSKLNKRISELMLLQGKQLCIENEKRLEVNSIHDVEFRVFSQFGEDGIIQYLIKKTNIKVEERIFIEFGVENYLESNTRFLLMNNNWRGLVFDGSPKNIESIKSQDYYWRHDLTAKSAWITRDNINELLTENGFGGDIGILSIDIDGNDYWVWEEISCVNPVIVITEWNSVFGAEKCISIPYDAEFNRSTAHHSNLFYGASISALSFLAEKKGYSLVGSNSAGNNLFFVRNDRLNGLKEVSIEEAYIESKIRESRDKEGKLSYLSGKSRIDEIRGMVVTDVISLEELVL